MGRNGSNWILLWSYFPLAQPKSQKVVVSKNNQLLTLFFLLGILPSLAFTQTIRLSGWERVIPSKGIPETVKLQNANNNLDLALFKGRYFLSIRTAPTHFASKKTMLYILSSTDLQNWEYEMEVHLGYDMREPRFVEFRDSLRFFFFEAGKHPLKFEPRNVWTCSRIKKGVWTQPKQIPSLSGFVPWRIRTLGDTMYMSAYFGQGLYQVEHTSELRLFISQDGYNWEKISEEPQVTGTSAEEGEFIFDQAGNLWGTVRREDLGGIVVFAHRDSLHIWKKRYTKYKYDSACLFTHKDEVYLLARRNLDGPMGHAPEHWKYGKRMKYNLLRYSATKKRTALYKIDKESLKAIHILDFPSTGDNAFPGVAPAGDDRYLIMNYTNDFTKGEKNWIRGQLKPTHIYRTFLEFKD